MHGLSCTNCTDKQTWASRCHHTASKRGNLASMINEWKHQQTRGTPLVAVTGRLPCGGDMFTTLKGFARIMTRTKEKRWPSADKR